jgi:hypothetical protein
MAILLVGHLNKSDNKYKSVEAALGGSRRLIGVSRSIWVWGSEPRSIMSIFEEDEEETRTEGFVLANDKNSYGAEQGSHLYERVLLTLPGFQRPYTSYSYTDTSEWRALDVINAQFAKELRGSGTGTKHDQCQLLIVQLLNAAGDDGMLSSQLQSSVLTMGYNQSMFEEARADLARDGVIDKFKDGGSGPWYWRLGKLDVPDTIE